MINLLNIFADLFLTSYLRLRQVFGLYLIMLRRNLMSKIMHDALDVSMKKVAGGSRFEWSMEISC